MTTNPQTHYAHQRSSFSRTLVWLLLLFIFYGTTVEAAHKHGNLVGQAASSNVTSLADAETAKNLGGDLVGCGDCLICQLHQNFSTTVISVPPNLGPSSVGSSLLSSVTLSVRSQTSTPRTGRAPPLSL